MAAGAGTDGRAPKPSVIFYLQGLHQNGWVLVLSPPNDVCHGHRLCEIGREYGATTGRRRRCGWLDLPVLKYACMVSGVSQLMMMKADVLSGFPEVKVCTHYEYMGKKIDYLPYNIEEQYLRPIYETLPGWNGDLTGVTDEAGIPQELRAYIAYIEKALGVPITIVSVGPDRTQTILRAH